MRKPELKVVIGKMERRYACSRENFFFFPLRKEVCLEWILETSAV